MDRGTFLDIIGLLQSEFDETAGEGVAKVLDEQAFMKLSNADLRHNMYIAVRFGAATTNYGQTSLPISLICCGFVNKADVLKTTLVEFALRNNLRDDTPVGDAYCLQLFNTPTAVQNFAEMAEGFTSLFVIGGFIVFGDESNRIKSVEYHYGNNQKETLRVVSSNLAFNVANNTQPKVSSNGMATSVGQYGTLNLSLSTYLVKSELLDSLIDVIAEPTSEAMDRKYHIVLEMSDGKTIDHEWKLVSFAPSQALGTLPMATLAFTL